MRVQVIHSRYLSGPVSGENRVVEDEVRLLEQAGHQAQLWAPETEDVHGLGLLRSGARAIWSMPATSQLRNIVRDFRPDIIHFHNLYPALSPAVLRAARNEGVVVVVTLHSYRLLCLPATFVRDGVVCEDCLGRTPWPGVLHGCYRGSKLASSAIAGSITLHRWLGSFDRPKLYLTVSSFLRDKYIEAGWPSDRLRVKSNFAWPSQRRVGAGEYFLYLGRLAPEKGVMTLIRAWAQVKAPLLVVGDGPQRTELQGVATPGISFLGTLPPEDVGNVLQKARALLVPSEWFEGQPRAILEAYASGVPVIASRIGGLPEVVHDGVSGLLVPPSRPDAWSGAVRQLLSDAEAQRLGDGAWNLWSTRYRPEHGVRELEAAYQTAMSL